MEGFGVVVPYAYEFSRFSPFLKQDCADDGNLRIEVLYDKLPKIISVPLFTVAVKAHSSAKTISDYNPDCT
jgi:hypothetical protein